jgi:hypothetical protein
MPKFKVKKVNRFVYEGKRYKPGDIVELPERFTGLDFLEPVKERSTAKPLEKPEKPKPLEKMRKKG